MRTNHKPQRGQVSIILALLVAALMLTFLAIAGVASFFFIGGDARALRNSFLEGANLQARQRLALNVGGATAGLMRFGARWVNAPPEAQAGIAAFRGADVGIYRLAEARPPEPTAAFAAMDRRMSGRGWDRVVGVTNGREFVAVYLSRKTVSFDRVNCCFLVMQGDQLVVGSARASLRSILELPEVKEGIDEAFTHVRELKAELHSGAQELQADLNAL